MWLSKPGTLSAKSFHSQDTVWNRHGITTQPVPFRERNGESTRNPWDVIPESGTSPDDASAMLPGCSSPQCHPLLCPLFPLGTLCFASFFFTMSEGNSTIELFSYHCLLIGRVILGLECSVQCRLVILLETELSQYLVFLSVSSFNNRIQKLYLFLMETWFPEPCMCKFSSIFSLHLKIRVPWTYEPIRESNRLGLVFEMFVLFKGTTEFYIPKDSYSETYYPMYSL